MQTLGLSLPITTAIIALIAIVMFSYRQMIEAYPQRGLTMHRALDACGNRVFTLVSYHLPA